MNARRRRITQLQAAVSGQFEDIVDLMAVFPEQEKVSLQRVIWRFAQSAGIVPAGLGFPIDAPTTAEARERLARFDAGVTKWSDKKRAPAEELRLDQLFAELLREWLALNPRAGLILDMYQREFKRR